MTVCICLNYIGGGTLGPTIELTCNPSGTMINQPTSSLLAPTCPLCLTVPSGTTSITAFDPVTNCTEVINVTPVPNVPCSFGMDVVFLIDYTGSMGGVINKIKQEVSTLTNSIVALSNNNYRLGLVVFDEFIQNLNQPIGSGLPYYNQFGYQSLPVQQRYINTSTPTSQAITAFEILSPNNQSSFITKLSNLNLVVGNFLSRLNPNGVLEGATPTINNTNVTDVKYQIDGKILIAGNFTIPGNGIMRITQTGTIDTSFIVSSGFNNPVNSFDINSIGQIIVGGTFTTYQGIPRNGIALLNTNGSLDLGFLVGTGFDNQVQKVKFQSDGKIIVGGTFLTYNGVTVNRICRLNTDGTLDTTFNSGSGIQGPPLTIEIQSDGKILVGGQFAIYNGSTVPFICRLNTDGTLDGTFTIGSGFNNIVNSISIQPDGKIVVGGQFTTYNGSPTNRICRLNTNGTLDGTFNVGTGFNNTVNSIKIQSDGKIIVCGTFLTYNGVTVNRICRLNTDGTLDTSFGCTPVEGANSTITRMDVDGFDNVCVGGSFTQGVNKNCSPGIVLGDGWSAPEPWDMSIDRIVNYNLTGNFNPLNSKTIILITDASPSGNDDNYTQNDINFINNVLIPSCVSGGIKVLLVLPTAAATNPVNQPFLNIATLTGGQVFGTSFDSNFNVNGVITALANLC